MYKKLVFLNLLIFLCGCLLSCGAESTGEEAVASSSTTSTTDSGSSDSSDTSDSSDSSDSSSSSVGSVSGTITDAENNSAIQGATVYISGDQAGTQVTTDAAGAYSIANVAVGSVNVVAEATNYNSQTLSSVTITANTATEGQNMNLVSSTYGDNMYVAVLTWGTNLKDIDSHLYIPNNGSGVTHIYYSAKGDNDGTVNADPQAALDRDDTDFEGPETIRIAKSGNEPIYDGDYRYCVHRFTNPGTDLSDSSATVKLFDDGSLVKTYTVPAGSGTDRWWHVFDIDTNGSITDANSIQAADCSNPN